MTATALWKAIYTSGHDAARLTETPTGWRLEGAAVFAAGAEPVRVTYALDLASDWSTQGGAVDGYVGSRNVHHHIERQGGSWLLNGIRQDQADSLVDLDFGFTPATNYPQLRRMDLSIGASKEIVVAWLDVDTFRLKPLRQIYRRLTQRTYEYHSPQGPYEATLQIAENGFVAVYPELWQLVAQTA